MVVVTAEMQGVPEEDEEIPCESEMKKKNYFN
jgi:hypothetical protein